MASRPGQSNRKTPDEVRDLLRADPRRRRRRKPHPEEVLHDQLKLVLDGRPAPVREYRVPGPRAFRFDFAWPDHRLGVEVDGGIWSGGRHVRGAGFERDLEKMNQATLAGWRVLRFTTAHVSSGYAIRTILTALEQGAEE